MLKPLPDGLNTTSTDVLEAPVTVHGDPVVSTYTWCREAAVLSLEPSLAASWATLFLSSEYSDVTLRVEKQEPSEIFLSDSYEILTRFLLAHEILIRFLPDFNRFLPAYQIHIRFLPDSYQLTRFLPDSLRF